MSLFQIDPSSGRLLRRALEINVAEHCNLACAGCDHGSPLLPEKFLSPEVAWNDMEALARVLHVEELKLVGGEPLLHPDLESIVRSARRSGISTRITLVTNGVLLHRMPEEIWGLIDKLWVSRYPGVPLRLAAEEMDRLARENGVELWVKETPDFRVTILNNEIRNRELVRQIYRNCAMVGAWSCHTLHEGRYYKCSPAPFQNGRLKQLGIDFRNEEDGIPIHGNSSLRRDLESYLLSREPLKACSWCLGSIGRRFPNHQANRRGLQAWRAEDHSNVRDLIIEDLEEMVTPEARMAILSALDGAAD